MKEVRIGVIGTGDISHRHMTVWSKIPGAKVVAACEVDEKKLKAWGEQYKFDEKDLYRDYRDLLARDDIDAVDVCVHNNLHTPISVAVMKAGKHCYCEKPFAGSYLDSKIIYDAAKAYNVKLAVQISSIYNYQTRLAKKMVKDGKLGKIYHARSVGYRRSMRPSVDVPFFSPAFIDKEMAGWGPMLDTGVYHISQILYILGMPELKNVYGRAHTGYYQDPGLLRGRKYEVEDLAIGIASFKNGMSMEVFEDWAIHMDHVGNSYIAGSMGGLKITATDDAGGELARNPAAAGAFGGFTPPDPDLVFYGLENDAMIETKLNCTQNQRKEGFANPAIAPFNDNQIHWLHYLRGDLTDETRIDTPWIALQTAKLSDGIFLSEKFGRSVTAEEIEELSESNAMRRQVTDWGVLEYEF